MVLSAMPVQGVADYMSAELRQQVEELKKFKRGGYVYDSKTSTTTELVFLKKE